MVSDYIVHWLDEYAVILLASERDTIRGNSIENREYLFIYMFGRTYVIFVL